MKTLVWVNILGQEVSGGWGTTHTELRVARVFKENRIYINPALGTQ
jgi:hypothetical protein